MKILLDTHIWLWWLMAPEKLSTNARETISDPKVQVFISAISSWEMAVKTSAGKLQLPKPLNELIPESLTIDGFTSLPIMHHHSLEILRLPMHHRDPFDRMLIAQARIEELTLVTSDAMFRRYDVPLLKDGTL